jgi:hypothetical protein
VDKFMAANGINNRVLLSERVLRRVVSGVKKGLINTAKLPANVHKTALRIILGNHQAAQAPAQAPAIPAQAQAPQIQLMHQILLQLPPLPQVPVLPYNTHYTQLPDPNRNP